MFSWKKLGRIYNPNDYPDRNNWMYEFGLAPCTLIYDDFVRVYFGCRPQKDSKGQYVTYTTYLDLDRRNLFEINGFAKAPVLTLGGCGTFDEFGTYPLSVVRRENDILGYYAGWTRCESVPFNVGLGIAVSRDGGVTFERLGPGPVLPYSVDEPFTMSGPKIRKFGDTYYLFSLAGKKWIPIDGRPEICHKIRLATSRDGLDWLKVNKDLIPDAWDIDESQASPDVFFANGRYHMFFCGWVPKNFRQTKSRKIGYAWSTDLLNWTRDDSKAGIDVSVDGFDNEMVAYPHVFELDGETYMLYLGNQVGRYGFGLAQLEGQLT